MQFTYKKTFFLFGLVGCSILDIFSKCVFLNAQYDSFWTNFHYKFHYMGIKTYSEILFSSLKHQ